MHPLRERACDELLEHPLLATPPPEPERPRPPRVRKPRVFKLVSIFRFFLHMKKALEQPILQSNEHLMVNSFRLLSVAKCSKTYMFLFCF